MKTIPIGIIGATGYTGQELVRILSGHPGVELVSLTSRQEAGNRYSDLFPSSRCGLLLETLNVPKIAKKTKAVFLCLPHHGSMEIAAGFRSCGVRVVDLSADFRIKDVETYEKIYGPHTQKKLLGEAVYGLPELFREEIRGSQLVAAPGCYPTSILLALAPLLKNSMVQLDSIICDSKSGVSGAGRSEKLTNLFVEVNEGVKAYNVGSHRHQPEIEEKLSLMAGKPVSVLFSPHLVPMDRGILSSIYLTPTKKWTSKALEKIVRDFYQRESFVKIVSHFPSTKEVKGTNFCHIHVQVDEKTEKMALFSVIDNLVKGASGQAVQAFNLMWGLEETDGLRNLSSL